MGNNLGPKTMGRYLSSRVQPAFVAKALDTFIFHPYSPYLLFFDVKVTFFLSFIFHVKATFSLSFIYHPYT